MRQKGENGREGGGFSDKCRDCEEMREEKGGRVAVNRITLG